jgi:hypothetical protein
MKPTNPARNATSTNPAIIFDLNLQSDIKFISLPP